MILTITRDRSNSIKSRIVAKKVNLPAVAPSGIQTCDLLIVNPTPNSPNSFCVFRQRATRMTRRKMNTPSVHAMLMLFNGEEIPPKLPLTMGDADPHLIHGYLGPPHPTRQTPSRWNQPSLHRSRSIIPIPVSYTHLTLPTNREV